MASVRVDSELMTNYVSAVPVPAGSHHVAALDEKRMPMVFSLSNDQQPRLRLLRRDAQGHSALIDLHSALGLPENANVQDFHVEQSWSMTLYLCVSYEMDRASSTLIVTRPFKPEALQSGLNLSKIPGEHRIGTVQRIYMSPITGLSSDVKYPDIFVVHKQLDQLRSWGSDITHVNVTDRWRATQELSTPENVSSIIDIAPAVSPYGQGIYVLYVTQGITKIFARFLRPDPNATDGALFTFVTEVSCPKSARCISAIVNNKGYSCLLIAAADGIRYLNVSESTSKDKPGKLIFDANLFKGIRQLQVAQDKSDVTIWFRTPRSELGYTRTKMEDLSGSAVSSLLLPAKSSSAFAPVVTRADALTGERVRQMVVSNDHEGNLMLLEQTDDFGLWRRTPFYAPSKLTPTEVPSYTVTIHAMDAVSMPLDYGSILISASSSISVIVNGRNILLTQVPSWFDCDESGSLGLIIQTDSLGSPVFRIESLKTKEGEILASDNVIYDPAVKPLKALSRRLGALEKDGDFGKMKTASGELLFDDKVLTDKDNLASAHNCLMTISGAYSQLPSNGSSGLDPKVSTTKLVITKAQSSSESFGDMLMDGWYWIKENVDAITDWIVDTAGSVWKFVCKVAGQIKEFVLDCVEKICEAATWIWEKLKVGWQKLVDFIGFIFDWDDILTTKNTISNMLTAGFGYAALKMDDLAEKVDSFFDGVEDTIDKLGSSIMTDKHLTAEGNGKKGSEVEGAQTSTSTSWASERLKNGGAGSNTTLDVKGEKKQTEATDFWNKTVAPEMDRLDAQLSKVGAEISALFRKEGSVDGNDLLNVSKSLLKVGISTVRGIIKGLLKLIKILITKLKDLGNAEIDIPIFSWLYQKISGGHPLTLFDAIALIVAIPTTIFAKLITGKPPPTINKMDAPLLKSLIESDAEIPGSTRSDFAILRAEVAIGFALTSGAIGAIKLLYKMATQGLDSVLDELDAGPSSLFDIFGICTDMVGCLMAIPDQEDLPGAEYRHWISAITCVRGTYHAVAFFANGGPTLEKAVLCLDLLTVLANFGLSVAVGVAEHEAATAWEEYDEDETDTALVAAGLNALSGIAYFTAFMFKSTNPDVSAGGACVMIGTMAGTAVVDGVVFKMQYDASKRARLTSPPAF